MIGMIMATAISDFLSSVLSFLLSVFAWFAPFGWSVLVVVVVVVSIVVSDILGDVLIRFGEVAGVVVIGISWWKLT